MWTQNEFGVKIKQLLSILQSWFHGLLHFLSNNESKTNHKNHFFGGCLYCKHKGFETQVMCDFLMRLSTLFEVLVFFQRFALKVGNLYWQNKSFETKITNLFFPHCFVEISFFQTINLRFGSKKELLKFLRTYRVNKMVLLIITGTEKYVNWR